MKSFFILIPFFILLIYNANAHQDAKAIPISSTYKVVFDNRAIGPERSIEIISDRSKTKSIKVHFFNKPITIPTDELKGIDKIQLNSLTFHHGIHDGRQFCYIIAPFGFDVGTIEADYKRVRFFFQNGQYIKYTISSSRLDGRPEAIKLKGQPIEMQKKS